MNTSFVVCDVSGKILRWGSCLPDIALRQAQIGEFVVFGEGNTRDHRVVDGKIVSKSQSELNQITEEEKNEEDEMNRMRKIRERGQQILDKMAIQELKNEGKI